MLPRLRRFVGQPAGWRAPGRLGQAAALGDFTWDLS